MNMLFILNDAPHGSERSYNALRLAPALAKEPHAAALTVFLMADPVLAARKGQEPPAGTHNLADMLAGLIAASGTVLLCGSCMDARGMTDDDLVEQTRRSTMNELAAATASAEKVLVF